MKILDLVKVSCVENFGRTGVIVSDKPDLGQTIPLYEVVFSVGSDRFEEKDLTIIKFYEEWSEDAQKFKPFDHFVVGKDADLLQKKESILLD